MIPTEVENFHSQHRRQRYMPWPSGPYLLGHVPARIARLVACATWAFRLVCRDARLPCSAWKPPSRTGHRHFGCIRHASPSRTPVVVHSRVSAISKQWHAEIRGRPHNNVGKSMLLKFVSGDVHGTVGVKRCAWQGRCRAICMTEFVSSDMYDKEFVSSDRHDILVVYVKRWAWQSLRQAMCMMKSVSSDAYEHDTIGVKRYTWQSRCQAMSATELVSNDVRCSFIHVSLGEHLTRRKKAKKYFFCLLQRL